MVQDGVTTSYTYDALGQLIRVDDEQEGATWEYTYDQGGNILSKKKYVSGVETESMVFEYTNSNWRDQLTKVNGTAITYDQIGNPLNDGTWQYTWQNGRQLASMTNGETTASFVYNEQGLRVQKTVNGVVTKYTLHGKNVVHLTRGNDELHFFHDANGKPAIVVYNGVPFSYVKNLQGDIVAILDANGAVVVSYVYDAWGRPINKAGSMAATLGTVQPFRYRSYVFDEDVELYYLRSRYYNISTIRFINSDKVFVVDDVYPTNQYAYCNNSPVLNTDEDGYAADRGLRTRIHNEVCRQVAEALSGKTGFGMRVVTSSKTGYMDIVHNGKFVIEVKRITCSLPAALVQLRRYLNGTWVGSSIFPAPYSKVVKSTTDISGSFPFEGYTVVYCGLGNGFVIYDYYEGEEDEEKTNRMKKEILASGFAFVSTASSASATKSNMGLFLVGGALACAIAYATYGSLLQRQY